MEKLEENGQVDAQIQYVYILECCDGTFYTGWTTDLDARVKAHNEGKGAKYTRSRRPVRAVYYETLSQKPDALRREYEIKQFSRAQKAAMIKNFKQMHEPQGDCPK